MAWDYLHFYELRCDKGKTLCNRYELFVFLYVNSYIAYHCDFPQTVKHIDFKCVFSKRIIWDEKVIIDLVYEAKICQHQDANNQQWCDNIISSHISKYLDVKSKHHNLDIHSPNGCWPTTWGVDN